MKIIKIDSLYNHNYSVYIYNALKQYWDVKKSFCCFGKPKDTDMFLYVDGMKLDFTLKNGEKIYAEDGDLIYIPTGSEYTLVFYDRKSEKSNTVGIRFHMYDENDAPFKFSENINIFKSIDCSNLIKKINSASEVVPPCYAEMKAGMYDLISLVCKKQKNKSLKKFYVIEKGIEIMENDIKNELSISDIARICNVSEIYFRKLFKEYSGMPPAEYRLQRKIEKAKSYLEYDNFNVNEIASILGYVDSSYFCKQFKRFVGITPLEYKYNMKAEKH